MVTQGAEGLVDSTGGSRRAVVAESYCTSRAVEDAAAVAVVMVGAEGAASVGSNSV
eukprot:CAMPEP_0119470748 /NCGR_PEP_ID=MMETSP1344-20130328/3509_1 /TAXON_ID=236787 /ORGANISM="Florenciella parvula, Strain CCMP2471" /LENGTH=55 /DNA_ID=CAMNT_0007503457 /DNA_START=524 /DNA_END=692 /DNA_ORIENTATION=+